jgi:hypothetical protein
MMHGHEKSSSAIVAVKPTNKAELTAAEQSAVERTAAEPVESRAEGRGEWPASATRTGHSTGYACSTRWPAYGATSPWIPEVGTVCGKAARTGLVQRG